jgi:hypothetical protein
MSVSSTASDLEDHLNQRTSEPVHIAIDNLSDLRELARILDRFKFSFNFKYLTLSGDEDATLQERLALYQNPHFATVFQAIGNIRSLQELTIRDFLFPFPVALLTHLVYRVPELFVLDLISVHLDSGESSNRDVQEFLRRVQRIKALKGITLIPSFQTAATFHHSATKEFAKQLVTLSMPCLVHVSDNEGLDSLVEFQADVNYYRKKTTVAVDDIEMATIALKGPAVVGAMSLELENVNLLTQESIVSFCSSLCENETLEFLLLAIDCVDPILLEIAKVLPKNTTLKSFLVYLTDDSTVDWEQVEDAFAKALQFNYSCTSFKLYSVDDDGIKHRHHTPKVDPFLRLNRRDRCNREQLMVRPETVTPAMWGKVLAELAKENDVDALYYYLHVVATYTKTTMETPPPTAAVTDWDDEIPC